MLLQFENDDEYGHHTHPEHFNYFSEILKKADLTAWLGWDISEKRFKNEAKFKEILSMFLGNEEREKLFNMAIKRKKTSSIIDDKNMINFDQEITFEQAVEATAQNPEQIQIK